MAQSQLEIENSLKERLEALNTEAAPAGTQETNRGTLSTGAGLGGCLFLGQADTLNLATTHSYSGSTKNVSAVLTL